MKGIMAITVILITVIAIITTMGLYLFAVSANFEGVRRSIVERGIVADINEVELLKQNLHQALDYSFYQSKYEISALGGYLKLSDAPRTYNNLPYWRFYEETYFPDYVKNLGDKILGIYNIYSDSIKTEITKPGANKVEIEKKEISGEDYADVTTVPTKPMIVENTKIMINESGIVNETIPTKIFEQFDIGKVNFIEKDSVNKDSIREAVDNAIKLCKLTLSRSKAECGICPTADQVFQEANGMSIGDAEDIIKGEIRAQISKLENELNTDEIKVELIIDEVQSRITPDCDQSCGKVCNEECGCEDCSGVCRECNPGVCEKYVGQTKVVKTSLCVIKECKTTCTFDASGAARVLVVITDKNNFYPVYDGTPDLRNIQLKFYVVSGNKRLI